MFNSSEEKAKTSSYYKRAIKIWTEEDVEKRNLAKERKLNFKEFWKIEELKEWIEKIKLNE